MFFSPGFISWLCYRKQTNQCVGTAGIGLIQSMTYPKPNLMICLASWGTHSNHWLLIIFPIKLPFFWGYNPLSNTPIWCFSHSTCGKLLWGYRSAWTLGRADSVSSWTSLTWPVLRWPWHESNVWHIWVWTWKHGHFKRKNMIKELDLGVPNFQTNPFGDQVPNYRWWQRPHFTCYLTLHPWICRSNPVFWGCPGIHLDWRPRFCTYQGTTTTTTTTSSSSSSSSWQPHLQPVLYPDVSCGMHLASVDKLWLIAAPSVNLTQWA